MLESSSSIRSKVSFIGGLLLLCIDDRLFYFCDGRNFVPEEIDFDFELGLTDGLDLLLVFFSIGFLGVLARWDLTCILC